MIRREVTFMDEKSVARQFATQNKSPLKWLGNKSIMARTIVNMFPRHVVYIEPFLGSGSIFFAKSPSLVEIINDVNDLLVNFYTVIASDDGVDQFLKKFDTTLHSRTIYDDYKKSNWSEIDPAEKAFRFYYIIRNAWNGLYRVNADGEFNAPFSGAMEHRGLARRFFNSSVLIKKAHNRLKNATIECLDYKDVFKKYDGPGVLYFLDPPYQTTYQYSRSFDHAEFKDELKHVKGKWILTLDESLRDNYKEYPITTINLPSKMRSTTDKEIFTNIVVSSEKFTSTHIKSLFDYAI